MDSEEKEFTSSDSDDEHPEIKTEIDELMTVEIKEEIVDDDYYHQDEAQPDHSADHNESSETQKTVAENLGNTSAEATIEERISTTLEMRETESSLLSCCDKHFSTINDFLKHLKEETEGPEGAHSLRKVSEQGDKPFQCAICARQYSSEQNLMYHYKSHSTDVPGLPCDICGKLFKKRGLLLKHAEVHPGPKTHVCNVCGKAFRYERNLRTHEHDHNGDSGFTCSECGKMFTSKQAFRIHCDVHTNRRRAECEICKKTFSTKSNLMTHLTKHSGERNFQCDFCKKLFAQKGHLERHLRIHTGEKPHSCEFCGESFGDPTSLIHHRRDHTGEMPYVCEECGRCFKRKGTLNAHRSSHFQHRPFVCEQCGNAFKRINHLQRHKKLLHP